MIERTIPAVAAPLPVAFFPLAERTMPTIPRTIAANEMYAPISGINQPTIPPKRATIPNNKPAIDNIKITDYESTLKVLNQTQAIRGYYEFNDA